MALPARRLALALVALAFACEAPAPDAGQEPPATVAVGIGARQLRLELAADSETRGRGLGGRSHVSPDGGMLFAFLDEAPRAFVMRDCVVPLDIAFLDAGGRVVAIHSMAVEPPRRADESLFAYESRLRLYTSPAPAQFVVETAAGRLFELGLRVGDEVGFDRAAVLRGTQ